MTFPRVECGYIATGFFHTAYECIRIAGSLPAPEIEMPSGFPAAKHTTRHSTTSQLTSLIPESTPSPPPPPQSWPIILAGFDMIAVAKTGSGKTLGFLAPAFHMIKQEPRPLKQGRGPFGLVLAPTRSHLVELESTLLCAQSFNEVFRFNKCFEMRHCASLFSPRAVPLQKLWRMCFSFGC